MRAAAPRPFAVVKRPELFARFMADVLAWSMRFLHILSGVLWVGGAMLWGMVIGPSVLRRGPPHVRRPFLEAALGPFTRVMIVSGALTIVTGFWTMGILVGFTNLASTFQSAPYGVALGVGTVMALAMYAEGLFVIKPTGAKLLATMQRVPAPAPGAPPSPPPAEVQAELAALGKKMGIASMASMLMGVIALGAMAWAVNYVR